MLLVQLAFHAGGLGWARPGWVCWAGLGWTGLGFNWSPTAKPADGTKPTKPARLISGPPFKGKLDKHQSLLVVDPVRRPRESPSCKQVERQADRTRTSLACGRSRPTSQLQRRQKQESRPIAGSLPSAPKRQKPYQRRRPSPRCWAAGLLG